MKSVDLIVMEGKTIAQVTELKYLWNRVSEFKWDTEYKMQTYPYNRMNSIIQEISANRCQMRLNLESIRNIEGKIRIWKWGVGFK